MACRPGIAHPLRLQAHSLEVRIARACRVIIRVAVEHRNTRFDWGNLDKCFDVYFACTPQPTDTVARRYQTDWVLIENVWFEYEIDVRGQVYTVKLTNTETGQSKQTTRYENTDAERGHVPGYVGIQAYPGSTVAYRQIQVHD